MNNPYLDTYLYTATEEELTYHVEDNSNVSIKIIETC